MKMVKINRLNWISDVLKINDQNEISGNKVLFMRFTQENLYYITLHMKKLKRNTNHVAPHITKILSNHMQWCDELRWSHIITR